MFNTGIPHHQLSQSEWADDKPWYFDEYEKPADDNDIRDWDVGNLLEERVDGTELNFQDFPGGDPSGNERCKVNSLVWRL